MPSKTPKSRSTDATPVSQTFNILAVAQAGRLQYEAILLLASLRDTNPDFAGRIIIAEPQMNDQWARDPKINNPDVRALLIALGAEILPFENKVFGASYPYGNKIEALNVLPEKEPFLFLDTDTLVIDDLARVPFDFDQPTASMKREGTWPKIELYGPGYAETWKSLYDRFGLSFEDTLDLSQPDEYWARYLYFNAGFFYYSCPRQFGSRFLEYAWAIRDDPPSELVCQEMSPWLDQVALPLVIHSFGGGRDAAVSDVMDHVATCHYRALPLLYAKESDAVVDVLHRVSAPNKVKKVAKQYDPFKRMIYQGRGMKVRAMFDRDDLPRREQRIRNQIKRANLWMR
ncbi:hypothetical protein [Litoreibacter roseus]|uniref:Glycosyl transferase family 8 n=1 Tax=Litoreibacter roseus TaxID=2601869 RepID=A0A6N6JK28_9RHOB|nr:hypothetical protein [Litoreibacter roseus]GFE65638.1 hypothetical protein KIN_27120 [Litoreibacter roseus]